MPAAVEIATGGLIENVAVSAISITETAIYVAGNNVRVLHVNCGTSGGEAAQVLVEGDNAYLEDVTAASSIDCGVLVTGDRAVLNGIITSSNGVTVGDGVRFDTSNDSILQGHRSFQDAFGLRVLDSPRTICVDIQIRDPHQRGVVWDGSDHGQLQGTVSDAGEHGVQITDSDRCRFTGQVVDAGRETNNTYDGVFVDGDSDRNRTAFTVSYSGAGNQMRYGLNLSAATINNHVEASILDGTGATANYNDAGTGTVTTDDHLV